MRAAAADSLRRVQGILAAKPNTPVAVLCGGYAARREVRDVIGCPGEAAKDAVTAESACGMLVIEPPTELCSTSEEATELATFLKGLQQAHGVILAVNGHAIGSSALADDDALEVLSLVAECYSPDSWPSFLCLAFVGSTGKAGINELSSHLRRLGSRGGNLGFLSALEAKLPPIFCISPPLLELPRLKSHLQACNPALCEPLQASSPLLAQYRAIQGQLRRARPSSGGTKRSERTAHTNDASTDTSVHPSSQTAAESHAPAGLKVLSRHYTLMVFGKTGAGKSHLANLLVGRNAFESGDSLASVTNTESVRKASSSDGLVTVLDTIGFGDTRLPPETVVRSLRDTALEAPTGIDVLFFVLKKERVSQVEQEIISYVTQLLFGPSCLPNLYLIVTHAGKLAKDTDIRTPWLQEQIGACPPFAAMIALLGVDPLRRIAFIENPDPSEAEDEEDRALANKKRQRAISDVYALLENHFAPPYRHGIMERAGELRNAHMEELKRELRGRIESEVREQLEKDRGAIEEERRLLRAEAEGQHQELQAREADLEKKFQGEWERMRDEFQQKARELARDDLEPIAQEIVEQTEKKNKGRRCIVM